MGLDEFRRLRKGHQDKIALAAELRQSTTMTMAWIAEELNAGVPQTLWRALWKNRKKSDNTRDCPLVPCFAISSGDVHGIHDMDFQTF